MRKVVILSLFLTLTVALTACGKKPDETVVATPTPITKETVMEVIDSPFVSIFPTNLARTLILKTENLGNFTEGDYELLYQAKEGERGIIGKLTAINGVFLKEGLDLGSRSRGTFRPDSEVTGGELTIRFHDDNRSKTVSEFAIFGQVEPDELTLPNSQTILVLGQTPTGQFIMLDTSGLPTQLSGYTPASRPIGIFPETSRFTDAKLTIPITSDTPEAQLVVVSATKTGDAWVELEDVEIANGQATFPITTGGVYLVVSKTP